MAQATDRRVRIGQTDDIGSATTKDPDRPGVKFNMRVNHGVTHSVYINDPNGYGVELLYELPRQMWERDIDAGLNYLTLLPTEGPEALVDDLENAPSFGTAAE
jgi:catechol 2,3-dioxygenase